MDWLFHLRNLNEGMFQLHATEDVFVEALHATRKRNPRAPGTLLEDRMEKIRACVDEVLPTFPGGVSRSPDWTRATITFMLRRSPPAPT